MLPFCGYNMGDYFQHWLSIGGQTEPGKLPRIFYVNWFRKSADGSWLWPGYGENSRVLKWIYERVSGDGKAVQTPIGYLPTADAIDISGSVIARENMELLLTVDTQAWIQEVESIREHYRRFGDRLPEALNRELESLEERLRNE